MKFKITKTSTGNYTIGVSYSGYNPFAVKDIYAPLAWDFKDFKRVFSRKGTEREVSGKRVALEVVKSYIKSRVSIVSEGEEEVDYEW